LATALAYTECLAAQRCASGYVSIPLHHSSLCHRARSGLLAVGLHTIRVPWSVTPIAPTGEQNAPGVTVAGC
jgi:hypothetical protein